MDHCNKQEHTDAEGADRPHVCAECVSAHLSVSMTFTNIMTMMIDGDGDDNKVNQDDGDAEDDAADEDEAKKDGNKVEESQGDE